MRRGIMSTEPLRLHEFFEYLLAVKNLNEKVIRKVKKNDQKVWWEKDLPDIEGYLYWW